ncbi:hypothetical protein CHS0354_017383 [Potamilus streckersoni]|uniref:Integrin beta n=1 Tax=Potamilus streckersoni TaxID=2493646 RepID=A0AAE0T546_9BIVA|nr:hypothetical protein CHS0354_017383 [Potamilus streckersoni]
MYMYEGNKKMRCLWILSQFVLGAAVISSSLKNLCNQQVDCESCITTDPGCAFCTDANFITSKGSVSRCSVPKDLNETGCTNITFPLNHVEISENKELNGGSANMNPIQVKPQHIKLKLRPGMEYNFTLTYRVAENLPVDMYFVLDMTITMQQKLKTLESVIDSLVKDMERFTSNILIGFGTFVDKTMSPYSFTTKEYLENPCIIEKSNCSPANEFTHRQKLSNNPEEFKEKMKHLKTSANWDVMEGGLDGVMQAVVCQEAIGWRNESRRVLVYFSDAGFHFAGDGKLAGLVLPNDAKCHLDSDGVYMMEKVLDYPSLGQLAKVLDDNQINVFFAVDEKSFPLYEDFCKMSSQASAIAFDDRSSQIIQMAIVKYYKELVNKVEIVEVDKPEEMDIVIQSKCLSRQIKETRECTGLEKGKSVDFEITVKLKKCPSTNGAFITTFYLKPAGIQEKLQIDVEYICSCNCLDINDGSQCTHGNGTLKCGMCKCLQERFGDLCQCTPDKSIGRNTTYDDESCKNKNETGDEICSSSGKCQCGKCVCNHGFKGLYCQCNSEKCPKGMNGLACGGHGRCDCESCHCDRGYSGTNCDCPDSEESCKGPNGKVCNGKGKCECGKCHCDGQYTPPYCQECPTCEEQCIDVESCAYAECVRCYLDRNDTCLSSAACKNVTEVMEFPSGKPPCIMYLNQSCSIQHLQNCEIGKGPYLQVRSIIACVSAPNTLLIVLPIVAGIIGVGLILLIIWKVLTSWYDKIEYQRFKQEVDNPKWGIGDNPLYEAASTSYENPLRGKE